MEFKRFKTKPEKTSNFSVTIETILLIFFFFNSIKLLYKIFLKILKTNIINNLTMVIMKDTFCSKCLMALQFVKMSKKILKFN